MHVLKNKHKNKACSIYLQWLMQNHHMQNPKEWKSILQLVSLMHCCMRSLKVLSVNVNFFMGHLKSLRLFSLSGWCCCQLEMWAFPNFLPSVCVLTALEGVEGREVHHCRGAARTALPSTRAGRVSETWTSLMMVTEDLSLVTSTLRVKRWCSLRYIFIICYS